ncbi:MAG: hypothetical protein FGM32_01900 [Candidatus Kapabacteria bacterium]|nr:hypothetical protein [Candidatus Kapabacteria bacterium]
MAVIVSVAFTRLLPHWPNFTPVLAVALCGGMLYSDRRSVLVPLFAMVLSDVAMGFAFGTEYALHTTQLYVYACLAGTALLGRALATMKTPSAIVLGGLASGIGFFLVTNAAVWMHGTMYPHNIEGLIACYGAGLAFYRDGGNFLLNGVISTWMFSAVIFGVRSLISRRLVALN